MIDPDDTTRFDGIEQQTPPAASEQPPVAWAILARDDVDWHLYDIRIGSRDEIETKVEQEWQTDSFRVVPVAVLSAARYDQLIEAEQERDGRKAWIDKMIYGVTK